MDSEPTNDRPAETVGTTIGPYRLLEQIGEGGMGVVFMAEQQAPVRRKVALKIIKPGMDSKQVIARFEAERQALALMDHPNIARVLDAGTTESKLPYFVMELVRGIPVTEYCDQNKLATSDRLELFVSICRAVQHAHTKGIIHRDLKPSNVLITLNDGLPTPKVIDFGLARATNQQLTDKTLFTAFAQMVGTPVYMSPEQAEMSSLDIDTRSDIYSLGVVLYELLTGFTPLDRKRIKTAAYDEIRRIIREEDPAKPSTRISTIGEQGSTVALKRRTDAGKLRQRLRGELDWIALKSLEKDRTRRYQTASDFAEDVQRHLDGTAVQACPPTLNYRAGKFVQKHRAQVAASACFLALLVTSSVVAWLLYADASAARNRARSAEATALGAQREAESERDRAERNFETSEIAREDALSANRRLEEQIRVGTVTRLAAEARSVHRERPILGTLLAIEAVEMSRRGNGQVLPIAHEALLNATQSSQRGHRLMGHGTTIGQVRIASDWLVTTGGTKAHLWDLTAQQPWTSPIALGHPMEAVQSVSISQNRRWLIANGSCLKRYPLDSRNPSSSVSTLQDVSNCKALSQSADGQLLVTLDEGGLLTEWDLANPVPTSARLAGAREAYQRVKISPDGRFVVGILKEDPSRLHLWDRDAASDDPTPLEVQHRSGVGEWAISKDSRWLMTRHRGIVAFRDLTAEDPAIATRTLEIHRNFNVWLSPEFQRLFAVRGYTARIHVFDLSVPHPHTAHHLLQGHNVDVEALVVSRDGRRLATGGRDGTARIWELAEEGKPEQKLVVKSHDAVRSVAIEPTGRWLATAGADGSARLWELKHDDPTASPFVLEGKEDDTYASIAVSSTGRWVAKSVNDDVDRLVNDRAVQLWDLEDQVSSDFTRVLTGPESEIRSLQISPNDRWLIAGAEAGVVHLWDLTHRDIRSSHRVLPAAPVVDSFAPSDGALAVGPAGRWLASAQSDGTVRLWDLAAVESDDLAPRTLQGHSTNVQALAFSQNGRWLATGANSAEDSSVWLWELSDRSREVSGRPLNYSHSVYSLAINATSRWLAAGGGSASVFLWDLEAEDPVASCRILPPSNTNAGIWRAAISPNANWLFTGRFSRTAQLWDLRSRDPIPHPLQTDHGVQSVAISPDGRWLATGCPAKAILWDLRAPDPTRTGRVLRGHSENIWEVAMSADNRWLITAASDGTVRRWSLDTDWLLQHARDLAGRDLTEAERHRFGIPIPQER